jgi:hypothetical protein
MGKHVNCYIFELVNEIGYRSAGYMQRKAILIAVLFFAAVAGIFWGVGRIRRNTDTTETQTGSIPTIAHNPATNVFPNSPNEYLSTDPSPIFEEWFSASMKKDGMASEAIGRRLGESLRKNFAGSEAVYKRMAQFLSDPSISRDSKLSLISTLSRAATPSAVRLFLDLLRHNDLQSDLRQAVISALSQTGDYFWDKQFFPEAASILSKEWTHAKDPEMIRALANAIARVGGINEIDLLLDSIAKSGKTIEDIQVSGDPHAPAALMALNTARNPEVVQAIAKALNSDDLSSIEQKIYIRILGSANSIEAIRCLLDYAQNADSSVAEPIGEAFARIWDQSLLDYITLEMRTARFNSSSIQAAILSATKRS